MPTPKPITIYTVNTPQDVITACKENGWKEEQVNFAAGFVAMMIAARGWCRVRELVFFPEEASKLDKAKHAIIKEALEGLHFYNPDDKE
jgi:hypothetical protein